MERRWNSRRGIIWGSRHCPLSWPSMRRVIHGGFDRAHLCTVQSVVLWCPCPAYRLWSSAGTGRRRSPHLSHTPAPQWQRWRGGRRAHMLTPCRPLKQWLIVYTVLQTCRSNYFFLKYRQFERPTLVLFFSSQSGEGHSQWAWPFTSMQEAPKLHTNSSQEVGASGPVEEMG